MVVVHAQTVALRVAVREQAALQQLVGRQADARHEVRRRERGLLHLGAGGVRTPVEDVSYTVPLNTINVLLHDADGPAQDSSVTVFTSRPSMHTWPDVAS